MDRRTFLAGTGAVLLAALLVAETQPVGKVYRLGILFVGRPEHAEFLRHLYSKRLSELGWQDGRNLSIDIRHTLAVDHTSELASSLVAAKADVLVGIGPYPTHSLKDATRTIPIVLAGVSDPVGRGLVASLARPGGNISGVSHVTGAGFEGKERQILMECLPQAKRFAWLINPANPVWRTYPLRERVDAVHRGEGITLDIVEARTVDDIPAAIEAAIRLGAKGLGVTADALFSASARSIVELAAKHNLPTNYPERLYAAAGGLVSYGTDYGAVFRRSAEYVDKILRGTKPADLPIEQPTKFEFVINLKTAKALGLTIPPLLLLRADQVIE